MTKIYVTKGEYTGRQFEVLNFTESGVRLKGLDKNFEIPLDHVKLPCSRRDFQFLQDLPNFTYFTVFYMGVGEIKYLKVHDNLYLDFNNEEIHDDFSFLRENFYRIEVSE